MFWKFKPWLPTEENILSRTQLQESRDFRYGSNCYGFQPTSQGLMFYVFVVAVLLRIANEISYHFLRCVAYLFGVTKNFIHV